MVGANVATTSSRNSGHRYPKLENQMFERTPPSRAVLKANKAFKSAQPELSEYEKTQKALLDNRERLKSERLAREAAAGDDSQGPSRDDSR
jgi:hypothetical protein